MIHSSVRRLFERGGGEAGNSRIMKTKRKRSSLKISPFFYPDLGEHQKKRSSPRFSPFFCPDFLPKSQRRGGRDSILRSVLRYLCITGIPNGGHGTMPPKYATDDLSVCTSSVLWLRVLPNLLVESQFLPLYN